MSNQIKFWGDNKRDKRRSPYHPVIGAYVKPRIDFTKKYIEINQNTTLLDAGCGNGYFTIYWGDICDTTGMDYAQKMLDNNPHLKLVKGDVNDIPFEDNSFDIVFCSNLLHHVDDVKTALKEMRRVAKKYVIIAEDNRNNPLILLYALLNQEERGVFPFTKKYLIKQGKNIGLKHLASTTSSMIFPNKTPRVLLPLMRLFDKSFSLGTVIQIIFEK